MNDSLSDKPQGSSEQDTKPAKRRPARLRLPFDNRPVDSGEWVFDHRVGLSVTIIIYLLLGIAFLASKIFVGSPSHTQGFIIDLQDEAEQAEPEKTKPDDGSAESFDWKSVQNRTSNENALKDDRGTNMSAVSSSASEAERKMQANREAYERGLREAAALSASDSKSKESTRQDSKVSGRVTVSFSLTNPLRHERYLVKPAYRCEGGGEVVISITVNRTGEVLSAQLVGGGDECMQQTALRSARNSLFDINESAPARQSGTITYIFIPQ